MNACSKENVLPSFFVDDSKNAKDEYLVDYWLSWILRCAKEESKDQNKNLIKYSRRMLSYLLSRGKDNDFLEGKNIEEIKCWKFSSDVGCEVDVWLEVFVDDKKYALVIEVKVDSTISDNQLENYRLYIDRYYNREKKDFCVKYVFFRAENEYKNEEETKKEKKHCEDNGFFPVYWCDLKKAMDMTELTNNALFDEFWFNWENDVMKNM